MNDAAEPETRTGAEALLVAMKQAGIEYLFANAGTDFPPVIEALAKLDAASMPLPVTVPHETATVAMAHGYYLVTGKPQAVMVHVNVGLANAVMGVINAASDNVPVLVMSGRTPVTETGRKGSRATPIQYGQEMYDQTSLVRDLVKYNYEMRYPEQGQPLVSRAVALAKSAPEGPVYLSLPKEPLSENSDAGPAPMHPPSTAPYPDPAAIETIANWLHAAKAPVILCQRGDPEGRLGEALADLADRFAIAVAEPFSVRNVMATRHPMFLGYDARAALDGADVVLVLDHDIPWIEAAQQPEPGARIAHIGADPHFARMPVRGFRTDLAVQSDPVAAISALTDTLSRKPPLDGARRRRIAQRSDTSRVAARDRAAAAQSGPISAAWLSKCISDAMDDRAVLFTELGVQIEAMDLAGPNRVFSNAHAGGLGWALPAALGAQLADRDRLVIAVMGDGAHIFANPVACHQISEALGLPILTVIKNNGMWNAVRRSVLRGYPDGAAMRANEMPLTSLQPVPDYCRIAEAQRIHAQSVSRADELPRALGRAIRAIREERRGALIDVTVAAGDDF